jgi:hypothetical protein
MKLIHTRLFNFFCVVLLLRLSRRLRNYYSLRSFCSVEVHSERRMPLTACANRCIAVLAKAISLPLMFLLLYIAFTSFINFINPVAPWLFAVFSFNWLVRFSPIFSVQKKENKGQMTYKHHRFTYSHQQMNCNK